MEKQSEIKVSGHIQAVVANPSPLGLFGLAMVTLVACTQKLGLTDGTLYVIPWAIFLGAVAQLIAGIFDFKHNNTFGATAFCAYGLFWLGTASTWIFQNAGLVGDVRQLGYAFLGYFLFTVFMTIGAMGANKLLFLIFFLIDLLFLGLFMYTLGWGGHFWHNLAGVSELLISLASFYGCAATVLNSHYGFSVLPLGSPFGCWAKKAAQNRT